mgnify:CR=1 FL=1
MHAFLTTVNPELVEGLDTLHITPDPSIGIDEVRQIQFFLSRKPIQSDHNTVVIHQAHLLTLPAQHALLKTLEEPPPGAVIYLITSTPDSLLPTILSRVQITDLPDHPNLPDLSKSQALFAKLQAVGVGDRLKILEEAEFTRETALAFLDELEYLIHENINTPSRTSPPNLGGDHRGSIYETLINTRKYLRANCNLKLSLAHLAINL